MGDAQQLRRSGLTALPTRKLLLYLFMIITTSPHEPGHFTTLCLRLSVIFVRRRTVRMMGVRTDQGFLTLVATLSERLIMLRVQDIIVAFHFVFFLVGYYLFYPWQEYTEIKTVILIITQREIVNTCNAEYEV